MTSYTRILPTHGAFRPWVDWPWGTAHTLSTRIMRQRPHLWEDAPWDALEAYAAFCRDQGITMLEATFGWLLARSSISSVIAGATSPEQVRANAAAATAWTPTVADVAEIDAIFPLPDDPAA